MMRSAAAPASRRLQPLAPTFSQYKHRIFAAPQLLLKRMSFFRRLSIGSRAIEPASAPSLLPPQSSSESNWSQTWYSKRSQNITDDAVASVVLPSLQSLSNSLLCVSLGQNSIGDDGAISLSVVVASCRLLRRLDLSDNRIGSRGAIAISKVFDSCSAISEVVLSDNPFHDAGGCAIAIALRQCAGPNVELLLMSHCGLSSSCIQELAAAMRVQSKIISLDLSRNDIDSAGAECLSESLAAHTSIQHVDLSHNHIGDDGMVAVSQCLSSRNFSIKCIGLENNGVTTSGAVQFLTLLHSRKGLDFISLGLRDPCGTLQSVVKSDAWQRTGLPSPPDEVRDWIPGLAFIHEALVSGRQTLRRMRFMLIGNGLAGKTRLAGALLNTHANTHPHVEVDNRTIGIDCAPLRLHAPAGAIDVQVWDFAGQEVSHLCHTQFFNERRCLYLLVWSPFQPPEPDVTVPAPPPSFASVDSIAKPLILWMEMLFLNVPGAQFILCGTHSAAAKQLSEADYAALSASVEARVRQKMGDLAALGSAELRDLITRRHELEAILQDLASSMPSTAAVSTSNREEVAVWARLSKDNRLTRAFRSIASDAANHATLLKSIRARIEQIEDHSTVPPSHKKLQLLDCACVDSGDGSGIPQLCDILVQQCESMPVLSESIPKAWVLAESMFSGMHAKLGNVISRDDAVSFLRGAMSDLEQPWQAIKFWGDLGRVFVYESSPGSSQQWWIVPDMMFLLDLIRPLIHWDPCRMLTTNPEFCVASALELHSDDRGAAEELLADLKQNSVLRRRLLRYLAKWNSLQSAQQDAMLDFFHKCHLICALDDSPALLCVSFQAQASSFLVTARVRDMSARLALPVPSASDLKTYHAQFCLPLLHVSFLMRIQSHVLARQTSIKPCVQAQHNCLFVRRSTRHTDKFYCCIQSLSSADFSVVQRSFTAESKSHDEYQHTIYVHSDDLGLFQCATQVIEDTLATLFSGLRYRSYMLADRDKVTGLGVWKPLGQMSVPTFTEIFKKNWFEEFSPGNSLHSLFPHKRCPIFISHSWSDGTESFVRLLRARLQHESIASVCLDSAFFDQSACAVHDAFRSGLCEAAVVIVCLTPRYVTRPNCLKEFQWALDLSDKKRFSVVFLPLHPALTYDGIKWMLKHKAVYVSAKDDASCRLFPLSELACVLLNRYLLEHLGAKNWTEMKAWLSDGASDGIDDAVLATEVRRLVSRFPDLAVESNADENEALCKDVNEELKELSSLADISKKDISQDHLSCFSPGIYPEESAARFFWAFSEPLELREAGVLARFNWRNLHVTVVPHFASNAKSNNDVSFQVQCQSIGADAELKLLLSDSPPCEDPKSRDKILISAVLLPIGTRIDKVRVEAVKRERWLHVMRKLSVHETRVVAVQAEPRGTPSRHVPMPKPQSPIASAAACDLYISACRRASVSAGRNMQLYLSAIMDSLVSVVASQTSAAKITFRFGNFMAESSEGAAASAKTRVFVVSDDIASALIGDAKRCQCEGCREMYDHVDATTFRITPATRFVLAQRPSDNSALSPFLNKNTIREVSFAGLRISDCIPLEAYGEGTSLDSNIQRLLQAHQAITSMMQIQAQLEFFTVIQSADLIQDVGVASKRGSFGEVSKCTWKGTPVAVRTIMNVADVQAFQREARMMHSISHPNCVRLYGVCAPPNSALVMEWMGGGDLEQFLSQRPLPQLHRRLSLFRQVCAGLNSLHGHDPDPIVHRDLKPANLLLDSDQKVAKIADFGLSKIKTASYAGSNAVGTLIYCAPEMLLQGVPSHRPTDIFAMGLILWEMLAGKLVWHNADGIPLNAVQLIAMYNIRQRPSLDELPPGLDPAVIALMQDCWAEDPAQRPTADQLWRRMSALDPNNPEHNKPLQLYPDGFAPICGTLEDCLRFAVPADVFDGLLRDMPVINRKYGDASTQAFVRGHGLSEVEAKCIIMFTHESRHVPDHSRPRFLSDPKRDNQFYYLFNKACRERDAAALHRLENFSFYFMSALNKLPNIPLTPGQRLYRGFGKRLNEMNDLYRVDNIVWWHYISSSSVHRQTAYRSFARSSGTLMDITGVCDAKDIQALSMFPSEDELLILPNTGFTVKVALSCGQARMLNSGYAAIPDNVDLVIMEALPPRAH